MIGKSISNRVGIIGSSVRVSVISSVMERASVMASVRSIVRKGV